MTDVYWTRDLAEASALLTKGIKVLRLEREGKTCWFIFENEKQCKELSEEFWFGTFIVNAKDYYEAMNTLKNRIFAS